MRFNQAKIQTVSYINHSASVRLAIGMSNGSACHTDDCVTIHSSATRSRLRVALAAAFAVRFEFVLAERVYRSVLSAKKQLYTTVYSSLHSHSELSAVLPGQSLSLCV